jgi:hypothetical protein
VGASLADRFSKSDAIAAASLYDMKIVVQDAAGIE